MREVVALFANRMEQVLHENDWKGGWKHQGGSCSVVYLLKRLVDERMELSRELHKEQPDLHRVTKEAVDIANFAMMIADIAGDLTEPSHD